MTTRTRIVLTVVIGLLLVGYLIPFVVVGIGGRWTVGLLVLALVGLVLVWRLPRRRAL